MKNLQESIKQTEDRPSKAYKKSMVPACDVVEKKDRLVIFLDLPGAKEESIEINYEKNILSVTATKEDYLVQGLSLLRSEYDSDQVVWKRKFSLSNDIDYERIEAALKEGVLRIDLPKRKESKPRKIELKH
jgi:HSP20 family protein